MPSPGRKWSTVLVVRSIGIKCLSRPRRPVRRQGINDALHGQARTDAESSPRDVDAAGRVDLGRGQRRVTKASGDIRRRLGRDFRGCNPGHAAVQRAERPDRAVVRRVRHDDGVPFSWTTGWPPSPDGAFGGWIFGPHVTPPSVEVLISIWLPRPLSSHFRIAVAVMRALRPRVADQPVLVVERAGCHRHRDRRLRGGGRRRSSGCWSSTAAPTAQGVDAERPDHPDVVLEVVGHRDRSRAPIPPGEWKPWSFSARRPSHPVIWSKEVSDKPVAVKLLDQPLVIWRANGNVSAF